MIRQLRQARVRHHSGVLTIRVLGSRGSGKTTLVGATARVFAGRRTVGAIGGEIATATDPSRMQRGLQNLTGTDLDYLFIENLGAMGGASTAGLGQTADVVLLGVADGQTTPLEHPAVFRTADLVVITKMDMLPHLPEGSLERVRAAIGQAKPSARVIALSAKSGSGLQHWIGWLLEQERRRQPGRTRAEG